VIIHFDLSRGHFINDLVDQTYGLANFLQSQHISKENVLNLSARAFYETCRKHLREYRQERRNPVRRTLRTVEFSAGPILSPKL
jgi:hypothetical protein